MSNLPVPAHHSIMTLAPYVGGASTVKGKAKVVKLSSNEGAFGTNPTVVKAVCDGAESLFRYPDGGSVELRQAIGAAHGLDADRIVCGSGSDELIGLLCHAYLNAGDKIVITQYAFLMYRLYAVGCGADAITVPEKDFKVDVDAVIKAVTPETKIVFVANPGNPTGTYLTRAEMRKLCRGVPSSVMIVLDSAYAEFVGREDYTAGQDLVDEFPNVVMLRTFSKIYALGGIRLGWSYASQEITDVLNRVRGPFNVNKAAQIAGVAAVKDTAFVKKCFDHNAKWLARLPQEFEKLGLTMTPSVANFVLVHFPHTGKTAENADKYLQENGVIVRKVASYGLPDALRITIGTDEDMELLLKLLRAYMTD